MKKFLLPAVAVLALLLAPMGAQASGSGDIGCGGGNGATTPCNGLGLGTVTQNLDGSFNGSVDVALTGVSGLPSAVSGLPVFTPNTDQFDFSFQNVGYSFSDGGTFTFTDQTEPGVLSVTGEAELGGTPPIGLTGTLGLVLDATSFTFNYGPFSASGSINVNGNATLVLDPGNVNSMTGTVGLPNLTPGSGPGPTPEPGSLLLLGSGLLGLAPFIRRKFART